MRLGREAMELNAEKQAFTAFERLFRERGYRRRSLPTMAFRSLHPTGWSIFPSFRCGGLLGISIERIRPGHPIWSRNLNSFVSLALR